MSTRYIVLIFSGVIMVVSFFALIFSHGLVRKIAFYSLLGAAVAVIISFIVVAWADYERLRRETKADNDRLRRELAIYQATHRDLEEELRQMREVLFGHVLSCSTHVDQDFDTAVRELMVKYAEDRDG